MLDIVITGGTAVLPSGATQADIIEGERSSRSCAPGALAGLGGRVVDASGQVVIPGGSTRTSIAAGRCRPRGRASTT